MMDLLSGLLSLRDLLDKDKMAKFADSLPTPEQNIAMLKNGAMGLLNKAQDGANYVVDGLNKMADQATQQSGDIRSQLMQQYNNYMNPPPPAPQRMGRDANDGAAPSEPRYMAPDNSGEMWPESKIRNYYENLQKNFYKEDAPAPAPKAAPQPDLPVFLPEKKAWNWPQVYQDIMRDEPQMAWTKGMTPREQPAPQPSSGGLLSGGKGSTGGDGVSAGKANEPLGVLVGHRERLGGPKDVYTGDNPTHLTATMAAPAPEYDGQVVPIPDTPPEMIADGRVARFYEPLTYRQNYKAKQGLQDYAPPGGLFPNQNDVNFYRSVDAAYGTPEAGYLNYGARGSFYNDPIKMADRKGGVRRPLTKDEADAMYAAYMAAQKNPVSALGFQPDKFDFSSNPVPFNAAGETFGTSDRMFVDPKFPSVMVHEPFHYGVEQVQANARKENYDQQRKLFQQSHDIIEAGKTLEGEAYKKHFDDFDRVSKAISELRKNPPKSIFPPNSMSDPNDKLDEQENYVRGMMLQNFGPIEKYEVERQGFKEPSADAYAQTAPAFLAANADRRKLLEDMAQRLYMQRRRKMGPN